jgi:hypothetical protein
VLASSAQQLTGFYVWMSFGGMLDGVFNTLVAHESSTRCTNRPSRSPAWRGPRVLAWTDDY